MSYITRTSNIVMVDQTCFSEAISKINATSTSHGNNTTVRYNNKSFTIQRRVNGSYTCRVESYERQSVDQMFRAIERAYQDIQKERKEAEERERQRIAKLQKDLQNLTNQTSFEGIKHKQQEIDYSKIQQELEDSKQSLNQLQAKKIEFEKSRQNYISITKQQVEEKAKAGSWGLTSVQNDEGKRRTRIQLRRKVKN